MEQQEADRVVEQPWEVVEWGLRAWLQPDGFGQASHSASAPPRESTSSRLLMGSWPLEQRPGPQGEGGVA